MARQSTTRRRAREVRLGFIGCGGIARSHFKRLAEVPQARVVALADPSEASLQRFVEQFPQVAGLPTYRDYEQMLDEVEMEGVEIATPHTCHFEQVMECLGRGLHVLVEKPMVCAVDHAKKVIARAKRKQLIVMLSYQRHYDGAYRYLRQAIADGVLGKLHFVSARQAQHWYPWGAGPTWRGDPALSGGGQINDSGSHLVDILLWTTGLAPKEVFAYMDNMGTRVDILSAISVKFKGGALANISIIGHSAGWLEDFSVWGDKGALHLRDGRIILHKDQKTEDVTDRAVSAGNADRNFVEAILGKAQPQSDPTGGLRVIQLTQAAWESAKQGCAVAVKG